MSYSNFKLFFGDIHGHSNLSLCGVCPGRDLRKRNLYIHSSLFKEYCRDIDIVESIDLFYEYARDKAELDFAALVDHDFSMSDEQWSIVRKKAWEWYSPGKFVTFSGYEWTSKAYGHRHVIFLKDDAPIFRCLDGISPSKAVGRSPIDLWNFLSENHIDAITIPHHPSITQFPVDWRYYNPVYDRVVEIVSIWGVFEYYGNPFKCINSHNLPRFFVQDVLNRGYRLGIIGGGDTHDCTPAGIFRRVIKIQCPEKCYISSLSDDFSRIFLHNPLGSGFTGVYASSLTRESIFKAIYDKRVYAVVGGKIRLEFSINDVLMGSELKIENPREKLILKVYAEGDYDIDRVEVVKNGKMFYRKYCKGKAVNFKLIDDEKPNRLENYYYVRIIQRNGARAWSSPIWVIYKDLYRLNVERKDRFMILSGKMYRPMRIKILFIKDDPFQGFSKSSLIKKSDVGAFFWLEKNGYEKTILKVRFKSIRPTNFRGSITLKGFKNYDVYPIGFSIKKFGSDLFTDNYKGYIEWNITPSSNIEPLDTRKIKGLDIVLESDLTRNMYAIIDVYIDGERAIGKTFLGENRIDRMPFKIPIINLRGKIVLSKNIKLKPKETFKIEKATKTCIIYPGYIDKNGFKPFLLNE